MKFKVGDRVRFTKSIIYHTRAVELGEIYTIKTIDNRVKQYLVNCKNKNGEFFSEEELTLAEYTYEDLKKSPIGTKITFASGETLVKDGEDKLESSDDYIYIDCLKDLASCKFGKIVKIEEPEYTTVYEVKPEILDEAEKRYLRDVIKPFRDKVQYVKKFAYGGTNSIDIQVENKKSRWLIELPPFKRDTMYKNMEDNKEYTLEELGL